MFHGIFKSVVLVYNKDSHVWIIFYRVSLQYSIKLYEEIKTYICNTFYFLFKYDCDNIYFGCPLLVFQGISDLLFSMCTFFNYLLFDTQHDPIRTKDKGDNPHVTHD